MMVETRRRNDKNKVIITAALAGAYPTKDMNPAVPITPKELAEDAIECYEAGAAVVHIHVRDDEGKGTMDYAKFEETVNSIRDAKCPVVINLTTSGEPGADSAKRMAPFIGLRPELASFDAGSMNWGRNNVFLNEPAFLEELGLKMQECGVKPELEVFDMGMLYDSIYYIKKGIIKAPAHFQICLGAPGGMEATTENLLFCVNHLPEDCTWSTFGIGKGALEITYAGIALGGGIRVGMEDNIYYSYGVLAKSNAQFVERTARLVREFNKTPATPDEAREILGLNKC